MIKPLQNYILVEPEEFEDIQKQGTLYIPNQGSQTNYRYGKVLSVGPGIFSKEGKLIPPDVCVNDRVYYHSNSGTKVQDNNKTLILIKEIDILAVVD